MNPVPQGLDLDYLKRLALEAQQIQTRCFDWGGSAYQLKDNYSAFCEADRQVCELLATTIPTDFPQVDFVSEEGGNRRPGARVRIVADETDGSDPFVDGTPAFTFTIGVVVDGEVVLAVVNNPIAERLYWAELGKGAYVNDQPIRVKTTASGISGEKIAVETSSKHPAFPYCHEIQLRGGRAPHFYALAYQTMLFASGQRAGVLWTGTNLHDAVAPYLIMKEAGGIVTDITGEPLCFDGDKVNGMIAGATPEIHAELLEIVKAGY